MGTFLRSLRHDIANGNISSRQHIAVREEIKFARGDITEMKQSQQNLIFLVRSMFVTGQEREKSLISRAEKENTKSETRLLDLWEKLRGGLAPTARDRESLDDPNQAAVDEFDSTLKRYKDFSTTEESSGNVSGKVPSV